MMKRKDFPFLLRAACLAGLCLLAACINESDEADGNDLRPGDRVPAFRVTLQSGATVSDATLSGRKSLILFFNTGCPDCRQELPVVQQLYERHGAEVGFVCISREEEAAPVRSFWTAQGLSLPVSAQPTREVYSLFARSGIPRIYIAGPDLLITHVFTDSPLPDLEELEAALQ